jgi:serine/threonine protein kinase
VAIKQLKSQLSISAQEKLLEEIGIMSKLHSPYVVDLYGVTMDQPYKIVMQFMQGGALRDFLKKQAPAKIHWKLRFQIGHDISQGLKYLHERKIVHADLKSPNVLLDEVNHARLADFGLASIKSENAAQMYQDTSQIKGSLLWMAPELFEKSRHTFASDIYSLGIVLWELATHRLPFENKEWELKELIDHTVRGEREEFPTTTPSKYKKLAERCWNGVAYERPDADEAAKALFDSWAKSQDESSEEVEMVEVTTNNQASYMEETLKVVEESKEPAYNDTKTKFGV